MKVAVTGGAGYLGCILVSRLLLDGHFVTVLDKFTYGARPLLLFRGSDRFRLLRGDARRPDDLVGAFTGADAVVHLAAVVGEPACAVDEEGARGINYGGTVAALDVARECNVRQFIFSSTCSNYGIASPDSLADEDAALQPLSEYARSKIAAEQAVITANGAGLPSLVFRFATLCGAAPRMRFDLLVNDLARAAACGQSVDIFAPTAWRPFLHVRDAAKHIMDVLMLGLSGEWPAGRTYNVVGENYQKSQLVDLLLRHFPETDVSVSNRQPDLRDYRVSGERIRKELGLYPEVTIEEAFLEVAEAVRNGAFEHPFSRDYVETPEDASRLFVS